MAGNRGEWRAREQGGFGTTTLPKAVRDRTLYLIDELASLLRERSSAALAELGLNPRQHLILCCINEFGACSRTSLARWTGLDRAEVATHLNGLAALYLLTVHINDYDRRHDDIGLTARGVELLAVAEQRLDLVEADLLGPSLDNAVQGRLESEEGRLRRRDRLRKAAIEALERGERPDGGERWEQEAG